MTDPIYDLATHAAVFVTVGQLSEYWGKHPTTIGDYIRTGRLYARKVGGEYLVPTTSARKFEDGDEEWRKRPA